MDSLSTHAARRPVRVLEASVAERIAAGEVIERPASVVKELVENSLDAGAGFVQVSLEGGGKELIEILDDGHGMEREDLALSVQRHATSKISRIEDLDRLGTLGFRGEALPSVAAVSELSILTRALGAETAFELKVGQIGEARNPNAVTFGHFLHSSQGTRIRAASLFAQVPARLKFLKSQAAEVSAVREWLERLALAHPKVGFRLLSDGRKLLELRGASEADRVKAVLAGDEDYPVVTVEDETGPLKLRLHWIHGLSLPHSRKLAQVVNGRAVRDRLLQQAMLAAFRQALLPGQFPALALYVDLSPSMIDVNVHPTKSEVRFLDSGRVFQAARLLCERAIASHGAAAYVAQAVPAAALGEGYSLGANLAAPGVPKAGDVPLAWSASGAPQASASWVSRSPAQHALPLGAREPEVSGASRAGAIAAGLEPGRYVGALFNTYLAYDLGAELALVDQHAAHERVRYEALRARVVSSGNVASQELLIPEAVHLEDTSHEEIERRLPWLEKLGFAAEIFGEGAVLVRAIPADWGSHELKPRLKNLLERALAEPTPAGNLLLDEALFERLASEACHSSVRAGDRLEREEALMLVSRLFSTEHPWNCPHGRPTVVRIPRGKLEEWFQRRV